MNGGQFSDPGAEKYIIGAILYNGFAVVEHLGIHPFEFDEPTRQRIFLAAEDLHASGKESTHVSLSKRLGISTSDLLVYGGEDAAFPTKAVLRDDALYIRECYIRRRANEIGKRLVNGEIEPETARTELDQIEIRASLPPITSASKLCADLPPLPPELIAGVLHRGAKLVLGGGSKSFKTWSLLDLAVSVAAGVEWWGFPTERGRVLYLNFEIGEPHFARRIAEVAEARGAEISDLDVWNLRGFATDAATILPEITRKARSRDYSLIVLDPLYKLLGGRDENSARDIGNLLNTIERLGVDTGAAVAFGSHFAKGNASGKESIDRISGSGVFARDPDTIITMTRHESEDAFTVELTLRNHPPQEPFVVRREHPLMVRDEALDPTKLKQVGGRKESVSMDDVLDVLGDSELSFGEWKDRAVESLFISVDTFKRRLRDLKQAGRIRESAINRGKYVRNVLGAKGANGCKTPFAPGAVARCKTPIGFAPAPSAPNSEPEGAE